jgi:hypothetical protein
MDDLEGVKLETLLAAIRTIRAERGIEVCGTPYGKHLGQGLAEFRARRDTPSASVLLRTFFHAHGTARFCCSAATRKAPTQPIVDSREIRRARGLLREFRDRNSTN